MTPTRARTICRLLGWGPTRAAREFNRMARAGYSRQHVSDMLSGRRAVSPAFGLFLRMSVRVARLERRLGPSAG